MALRGGLPPFVSHLSPPMRRLLCFLCFALAFVPLMSPGAPVPLFDGKTFEGWEGDIGEVWRVENSALTAGSLEKRQAKNNFLATRRAYANFDLTLKWRLEGTQGFVNGGVQFRSKRIPNHHEVSGYQADLGAGYDGALYDESRRNRILERPSKEVLEKARKPLGEWNDYRIRAEGARIQIWLNGVQTVDYTEADPKIEATGIIAVQIHGGATSLVQYKDLMIEELESVPQKTGGQPSGSLPQKPFALEKGDVVVFTGSENMVIEQRTGALESHLALHWEAAQPRFRHMSWEGDTVFRQNRMKNWGAWPESLRAAGATWIFAWFGQMEAMDLSRSRQEFLTAYGALLDTFAAQTSRMVLIAAPLFEKPSDPRIPDNTKLNDRIREFNDATRELAASRGFFFVDLPKLLAAEAEPLVKTRDGMHFSEEGMRSVGRTIARGLGVNTAADIETVRAAIVEKNRLWFDTWRCMNWAFAYGDRTTQPFAKESEPHLSLVNELKSFEPRLVHADTTVQALASRRAAPASLPPNPPRADPPALSPQEQMARFTIRPGYEVNLFADETLGVVRPIQIRWDTRGRLWVACTPAYPQLQPAEHGNDYILVLEDTDGDGRADKTVRFAEGLTMPMGFEFAAREFGGGIYVCESTQLVHLPDRDGDDKADGRRVILSGFGTGDSHQNANSLRWGPDGCLWFTQGYHIWSYVETPHGLSELNRSGVWRFNPRTLRLDSFLNESTAGLNCWGTAWDEFGQTFHGSGADTAIWHTTPALIPTLHPLGLPTGMARSKGKSMEPEILGSSHLPEELKGVLLKSTYYTSQVQLYTLKQEGSSFVSESLGDLLAGGNEFRPVETRVGPDGALYVCDWLNPVIGHYQASYRDPRRDRSHGRIWRVTASGRALLEKPRLDRKDAVSLIQHLGSEERWERDMAKFALYQMDRAMALPAAVAAVDAEKTASGGKTMRLLYELSGVFSAHEESHAGLLKKMMASEDYRHRAWAAHLIGVWADRLKEPVEWLRKAVSDPHPMVRLEGVVSCAWMPASLAIDSLQAATGALRLPMDAALQHALTQSIFALSPHWIPLLQKHPAAFVDHSEQLLYALTTVRDSRLHGILRTLCENPSLSKAARENALRALIETGSVADAEYALEQAPRSQAVLETITSTGSGARAAQYVPLLPKLLSSPHEKVRIAAMDILGTTGGSLPLAEKVMGCLENSTSSAAEKISALRALAKLEGKEAVPVLLRFADFPEASVRLGALSAASPLDSKAVAERVRTLMENMQATAEIAGVLQPLISYKSGAEAFATEILRNGIRAETAKLALQWMLESGRDESMVRDAFQKAAGIQTASMEYSETLVRRLVADSQMRGNATSGEGVFKSAQATCAACHKVGNLGGVLGPELSAVGRAMTPEMIVESVLWPKRQVKEGYLLTQIITKEGMTHQGYKASETRDSVTLKDLSGNPGAPILKSTIVSRTDAGTLMPESLTAGWSEQQLLDLFRYLFDLGK